VTDVSVLLSEIAVDLLDLRHICRGRAGQQTADHALEIVHKAQFELLKQSMKGIETHEADLHSVSAIL
jgi:hypothetical protein